MNITVNGNKDIVLVDDDLEFQFLFKRHFQRQRNIDNPLRLFPSGPTCLAWLKQTLADGGGLPSLVLMDVNMPEMNGVECVRQIRAIGALKDLPIITMLSSSSHRLDIEGSLDAGATCYMEKPFDLSEMRFSSAVETEAQPLR